MFIGLATKLLNGFVLESTFYLFLHLRRISLSHKFLVLMCKLTDYSVYPELFQLPGNNCPSSPLLLIDLYCFSSVGMQLNARQLQLRTIIISHKGSLILTLILSCKEH